MKARIKSILYIVIINTVILIAIELLLRLFNVGSDTSLIYKTRISGEEYLYLNKNYVLKYFYRDDIDPTGPNKCLFKKVKPINTYRIYVIGESTSRGFPYSRVGSFPFQLEQMLNSENPDLHFEVINFSMDATNSYVGLDILDEILKYPPDLAIIYYGNNEFIGFGGQGEFYKPVFQLNKFMVDSRIYQLIKRAATFLAKKDNKMFLEKMARKNQVYYNSSIYRTTIADFTKNYSEIITKLKERNVQVIACGVARNLKDFNPDKYGASTNYVTQIEKLYDSTDVNLFEKLSKPEFDRADYCFATGKYLLQKGNKEMADSFFERACSLDGLRLRAPSEINDTIKKLAEKYKISLVNIQETINRSDSSGIAGNSVMLEHVHPDLAMHTLIANQLASEIVHIVSPGREYIHVKPVLYRSIVDDMYETIGLRNLFDNYPLKNLGYFNKHAFENIFTATTNDVSGLKYKPNINVNEIMFILPFMSDYKDLDNVHLKYGLSKYHLRDVNGAFREFELAYLQNPFNVIALNNMAVISFNSGDKLKGLKMQHTVHNQQPKYIAGMINLWIMFKKSGYQDEANELEGLLTKRKIDVKQIKYLVIDEI
ncbi:MAG: hypothetical protein LH629_02090 [Ignavibacteria bacterium]|nr:hypothetical protein [Ignavibacteria bacterium]